MTTDLFDRTHEPFHQVLWLFYQRGGAAVDLFFIISGFIFFWLYQEKLAANTLSIIDFAAWRISRLYPLHILMLFVVAGLQILFLAQTGQYFVYGANGLRNFLESVVMYQRNGDHAAFNGPEWSVTVEIFLYVVFCGLAKLGWLRQVWVPLILVAASIVLYKLKPDVTRGICGFFLGGVVFQAFLAIRKLALAREVMLAMAVACLIGWGFVVTDTYLNGAVAAAIEPLPWIARLRLANYIVLYGLFPLTVLVLALHEDLFEARFGVLSWLGELSYSSYLLHFPLQLIFALTVVFGLVSASAVRSGPALLLYFAILIPLSIMVYRAFEVPSQSILRRRWENAKRRFTPIPSVAKSDPLS